MQKLLLLLSIVLIAGCTVEINGDESSEEESELDKKIEEIEELVLTGEDLKAINLLNKQINRHKENAVLYKLRGEAHFNLGNHVKSLADLEKSVELAPKNDAFLNFLGYVQLKSGDPKTAKETFEKVLVINDQNSDAYLNLGLITQEEGGSIQTAYNYYLQAYDLDPLSDMACNNMGYTHYVYGVKDSAMYYYNIAIDLNPTNLSALSNRAMLLADIGEYNRAEADMVQYLEYSPTPESGYATLCWLYILMEDYKESVLAGEKCLEIHPGYLQGVINLGYAYYMMKDMGKACETWKSQTFDPDEELAAKIEEACQSV